MGGRNENHIFTSIGVTGFFYNFFFFFKTEGTTVELARRRGVLYRPTVCIPIIPINYHFYLLKYLFKKINTYLRVSVKSIFFRGVVELLRRNIIYLTCGDLII